MVTFEDALGGRRTEAGMTELPPAAVAIKAITAKLATEELVCQCL